MNQTIVVDRLVTSAGVLSPGWIEIQGEKIMGVGSGRGRAQDPGSVRDLGAVTMVPGFVDLHVHGGGGFGYAGTGAGDARAARDAHLARGTTATLASLVTDSPENMLAAVGRLADLVREGVLRGIHLEGPWLSRARAGAHDLAQLRDPDPQEIDALLAAAGGTISMVTIAPELPGAPEAIRQFVDAGVIVAIGHTDADYAVVVEAIEAGARVATHLFNAMKPVHHREPGPVLALMEDTRVAVEIIADGVHLHPSLVAGVETAVGSDRVLLVTDAMDAAGCGDGSYRLGNMDVVVAGGVSRMVSRDSIAGSTATMDSMFRSRADRGGWGEEALVAAVRQTATNPARIAGWKDVGDIAVGKQADLVMFDSAHQVARVFRKGKEINIISTSRQTGILG